MTLPFLSLCVCAGAKLRARAQQNGRLPDNRSEEAVEATEEPNALERDQRAVKPSLAET